MLLAAFIIRFRPEDDTIDRHCGSAGAENGMPRPDGCVPLTSSAKPIRHHFEAEVSGLGEDDCLEPARCKRWRFGTWSEKVPRFEIMR